MKCHKVVFKGKLSDVILDIKNMRKRQDNCYIKHLKDENEKLKEILELRQNNENMLVSRMNRAIEYLNNANRYSNISGMFEFYGDIDDVIKILNGEIE